MFKIFLSISFQLDAIKNAAVNVHPLGKVLTMPGLETDDEDGTKPEVKNSSSFYKICFVCSK